MGIKAAVSATAGWFARTFVSQEPSSQLGGDVRPLPPWSLAIGLVASIAYVAFVMHWPVGVFAHAGHDDAWFFLRSQSLIEGRWFGPYSQMTLMKGPGYVFFLALNFLLGLPATLTQALLYALACGLFARAIFRLSGSIILGLSLFLLTLWHPAVVPVRMIRDDIYAAQTLLLLACLVHALILPAPARARRLWAAAAGLALVWLWLTREEGVWILPAVGILCVLPLLREPRRIRELQILALAAAAPLALLSLCNFAVYRTFAIVDFKSASYSKALSALQSVRVGEPVAYVPVPGKVRQEIYQASPAFAELKSFFEGRGRVWTGPGCAIYPSTCGDFAGGWFIWALRDAVADAGHYHSARDADRFYDQITAQVTAACRSGRLRCVHNAVPYMPAMTPAQWRQAPHGLRNAVDMLALNIPPSRSLESAGEIGQLRQMWSFDGFPRRTPAATDSTRQMRGWFYAKDGGWIQLRCADGTSTWIQPIPHQGSPDIAAHFADPTAVDRRFRILVPEECSLQPAGARPSAPAVAYDQLLSNRNMKIGGGEIYIDVDTDSAPGGAAATAVMDGLWRLYGRVLPILAIAAGLAYLVDLRQLALKRSRIDPLWILCHLLWLLVLTRVTVLLLVDLSSFPSISVGYMSAAFPLSVSALALTVFLPFRTALEAARRSDQSSAETEWRGVLEPAADAPAPAARTRASG